MFAVDCSYSIFFYIDRKTTSFNYLKLNIVDNFSMNLNPLVAFLKKSPKEFTKADIINYVVANEIKMIDFRYVAGDGRLKTLNFILTDLHYLEQILSTGERVDGSSLFPNFLHAGSSDL